MSEKIIQNSVCSLCGIENTVQNCFDQHLTEAVEILFEFAHQDDQNVEKVRKE